MDSRDPDRAPFGLFVPGRIEVLGKHTDYAGGPSLTCATEQGLRARVAARDDGRLVLEDVTSRERWEASLPPAEEAGGPPAEHWTRYPWTLARRLARDLPGAWRGVTLRWTSDLPQAAGLSSSSALIVLCYLALEQSQGLRERSAWRAIEGRRELAAYLAAIESGRSFAPLASAADAGTRGGAEDHTAILCSEEGRLRLWSYDPPRLERTIALSEGLVFAVATSGVEARKLGNAAGAYTRATRLAEAAARAWRAATGADHEHLGAMLRAADAAKIRSVLGAARDEAFAPDELVRRFEHFRLEVAELLPAACDALQAGDLEAFGRLVDRSQAGAEELLDNQVPQTSFLQRAARHAGARAASAFGAGFGGAVWALVDEPTLAPFLAAWSGAYAAGYPEEATRARFRSTHAAAPARRLDGDAHATAEAPPA